MSRAPTRRGRTSTSPARCGVSTKRYGVVHRFPSGRRVGRPCWRTASSVANTVTLRLSKKNRITAHLVYPSKKLFQPFPASCFNMGRWPLRAGPFGGIFSTPPAAAPRAPFPSSVPLQTSPSALSWQVSSARHVGRWLRPTRPPPASSCAALSCACGVACARAPDCQARPRRRAKLRPASAHPHTDIPTSEARAAPPASRAPVRRSAREQHGTALSVPSCAPSCATAASCWPAVRGSGWVVQRRRPRARRAPRRSSQWHSLLTPKSRIDERVSPPGCGEVKTPVQQRAKSQPDDKTRRAPHRRARRCGSGAAAAAAMRPTDPASAAGGRHRHAKDYVTADAELLLRGVVRDGRRSASLGR